MVPCNLGGAVQGKSAWDFTCSVTDCRSGTTKAKMAQVAKRMLNSKMFGAWNGWRSQAAEVHPYGFLSG